MENNIRTIKINIPLDKKDKNLIEVVDANTNFKTLSNSSFKIAPESINEEFMDSLSRKGIVICNDFFDTTSDKWQDPVRVEISNTNYSFTTTIKMEKINSIWTITSYGYVISIEQGALAKNANNKRGDLNFLALSFCLFIYTSLSGIKFLNRSNNKHIINSLKNYEKQSTSQNKKY